MMLNRTIWRSGARRAAVAAAALLLSACSVDKILKVPDPDVSRPTDFTGKAALPTLLAAAVGDFQVAFAGTGGNTGLEGLVNMTGLLTDEFFFTETFPTRVEVDKRSINSNNSSMLAIYFTAQRARQSTFRAESAYAALAPNDSAYSEALSLEGYSWILLAESYCSGVPVTKIDATGTIHYGTPLTTKQLMDSAINRFDKAITVATATNDDILLDLAKVGKARALIFQSTNNLGSAAGIAGTVTPGFVYRVFSSDNTDRQNNGVFELVWLEGRWVQADKEGVNGLPFRSSNDPRTPWEIRPFNHGFAFDNSHTSYVTLKYSDRAAATVLASYREAQLIVAENELKQANYAGATGTLAILNALRADTTGLAPLTPAATPAAQLTQLFTERAFWLYLTAHRLGDLRRLARTGPDGYGLGQAAVFPTGRYTGRGGGVYGTDTNFPIPIEESNSNPSAAGGCLDRNP